MKSYIEMNKDELSSTLEELKKEYQSYVDMNLALNMARGKPSSEQLDLSRDMLDVLKSDSSLIASDGTDARNYGVLDGLKEAKKLLADMMDSDEEDVIVYGNSSLNIMYDQIARSYMFGVMGENPLCKEEKVKWLCPSPGYDRHFGITESFGFEMITVSMNEDGPNMDEVEELVKDEAVKGIWCVPKYSNPGGVVYSDEVVKRLAALKPASKDFRIYWDNAYCVHHLYDEEINVLDILDECKKAGNEDMVYKFGSTSKITFPGAGIAALATSSNNKKAILAQMTNQTIGHDKLNQLRHVRYFKDINGLKAHMKKHADIIRPKFEAVKEILDENLNGLDIGSWTDPKGGYFISFTGLDNTAKRIVSLAKDAGVVMTGAGATYPYKNDPKDSNIRIAPTLPPLDEIKLAAKLFTVCVKLASVEVLLNK